MNKPIKILALRCALLIAKHESEKFKNRDDGGTCNFDTPYIVLKGWKDGEVFQAFNLTGMQPRKDCNGVFEIVDYENFSQGLRRTAMAEAIRDSLQAQGYVAGVRYLMD